MTRVLVFRARLEPEDCWLVGTGAEDHRPFHLGNLCIGVQRDTDTEVRAAPTRECAEATIIGHSRDGMPTKTTFPTAASTRGPTPIAPHVSAEKPVHMTPLGFDSSPTKALDQNLRLSPTKSHVGWSPTGFHLSTRIGL
jgi:hypothetical protein